MKKLLISILVLSASVISYDASSAFPGAFSGNSNESTGFLNIGAAQKQKSSAVLGYPGVFNSNGSETTGFLGIGAVQKDVPASGSGPVFTHVIIIP